jgi:hypothetical protein
MGICMRPGTLLTAIACFLVLAFGAATAHAQALQFAPFGGMTYGAPYYVTGGGGDPNRVYVVESDGEIRLVKDGVTQATPFLDISPDVLIGGEAGMFSMALAPDYAATGLFYVFYTRDDPTPGNQHFLVFEEFRRSASNPDVADAATRRIVMEIPHFTAGNHNGGQLQFGPDGYLYASTGDGGNTPNLSQDLTSRLGKLLRIDPRGSVPFQYSIPPDNPFADGAGPNADEIYAYGLRNPYRFSFDRYTGDLIIGDVGGGSREEIDFKPEGTGRGVNFGWPCFEGTQVLSTTGPCSPPIANHSPPAFEYRTGMGMFGAAAVNAGYVIRDPALPSWNGRFEWTDTYGDLPGVRTVQLSAGGSVGDASTGLNPDGLVFTSGQDACGHVYVGQAGSGGVVGRLEPAGGGALACKTAPELLQVKTKSAKKALKRKGIPVTVTCDVDCTVTATGTVDRLVRRKRRPQVRGATVSGVRIQGGSPTTVLLKLSKGQRKRLRKWLRKSGTQVKVLADAQGAGGGTATGGAQVPRATKKK